MTTAQKARTSAGLSVKEAAGKIGCSEDYLRRIEKSGGFSFRMAQRLGRLYGCSINVFLQKGRAEAQGKNEKRYNA